VRADVWSRPSPGHIETVYFFLERSSSVDEVSVCKCVDKVVAKMENACPSLIFLTEASVLRTRVDDNINPLKAERICFI
jgi:hypothetical protein